MLAVRPPEYFPRLAYFGLMMEVDTFVLADTFQYSRQSFQNRTKIRNPDGWQWLSIPLRGGQHGCAIVDVRIEGKPFWARKHWRALVHNYHRAPFFTFYEPVLKSLFYREWDNLATLTCASVALLQRLLGVSKTLKRASEMPGKPDTLSSVVKAAEDGRLLSPVVAAEADVREVEKAAVFRYDPPHYRQNFAGFEAGMSALDVLMNYGPEARAIIASGIVRP